MMSSLRKNLCRSPASLSGVSCRCRSFSTQENQRIHADGLMSDVRLAIAKRTKTPLRGKARILAFLQLRHHSLRDPCGLPLRHCQKMFPFFRQEACRICLEHRFLRHRFPGNAARFCWQSLYGFPSPSENARFRNPAHLLRRRARASLLMGAEHANIHESQQEEQHPQESPTKAL